VEWKDFIDVTHVSIQNVVEQGRSVVSALAQQHRKEEIRLMEAEDSRSSAAREYFALLEEEKLRAQEARQLRKEAKARAKQQVKDARRLAREQAKQARIEREKAESAQRALELEEKEAAVRAREKKLHLLRKAAGAGKVFTSQVGAAEAKRELAKLELREERRRRQEEQLMQQEEAEQRNWEAQKEQERLVQVRALEAAEREKERAQQRKERAEQSAMHVQDVASRHLLEHSRFVDHCRASMALAAKQSSRANQAWQQERERERQETRAMGVEDEASATTYKAVWDIEDERKAERLARQAMGETESERKEEEHVEALFQAELTARGELQILVA
jgi:hypothetical protein